MIELQPGGWGEMILFVVIFLLMFVAVGGHIMCYKVVEMTKKKRKARRARRKQDEAVVKRLERQVEHEEHERRTNPLREIKRALRV